MTRLNGSVAQRLVHLEAGLVAGLKVDETRLVEDRAWLKLATALEPLVAPMIGPRGDTDPVQYWHAMPEELKDQVRKAVREKARRLAQHKR